MIRYHAVNGRLTDASQASLNVSDLAILRGYGIFDFFLVKNGQPLFIEDYLDRFINSSQLVDLDLPVSRRELHEKILEIRDANKMEEGAIRLLLTGGYAEDSFTPQVPNWLVLAHENKNRKVETDGKLLLQQYQRDLPQAKTINYSNAIRMRKQVREAGAHAVLYHNGREVLESSRANIFFVFDGPVLATPSEGILLGITRKQILKISQSLMPVEVRPIALEEIRHAQEIFLTGSNKPILPITQIGPDPIGAGKVGPITKQLLENWETYLEDYLK